MKKVLLIGAVAGTITFLVVAALVVLGVAGYTAVARAQTQPNPDAPAYGPGMMGGRGMMGGWGMMGRRGTADGAYGPMHEYMVAAFAEALGLTPEELQAELDAGKTMWDVAEAQGLTPEEFQAKMVEARTAALEQAVEAGAITQEQADWMQQHMQQRQGGRFGPGNCHGGRWNNPPAGQP